MNFAEHKILNGNSLLEYTGKNARTLSLKILLSSELGINPEKELENLRNMLYNHEEKIFMLGNNVMGKFVLENISGNFERINAHGEIISISVNINLKESEDN